MELAKILVIDDDPICNGLLLAILGDDYQVISVNSGRGGIDAIDSLHPDLILLDITMPQVNGYQVIKHLKNDPLRSAIPIIVISSLTEPSDREFALELGADDYISKPVMPTVIQDKVDKYLKK